ncbi:flagellin biosynthesis protein FlgD [Defluviimonas sp. WL0002]|uniref:Basal-body rod modification protein FlgD n=1 Tax=Albidovulum marisflavi TaxID=2984159 RepID=A0ABT2Z7C3_9RHOB|nr:flagellar hook capping FlgD N-terminal domain-containing protein [Defluviimonas sp. WL0002]MCV2867043.1 flagellin biosynthesis protein FlgD [Defluviimonas sp. WL0002]
MQIAPVSGQPSTGNASPQGNGGTLIESDFNTFLVMLTTQLQNQDPLNPIESSDYAAQLATFSGVEQQVRTNQLLQALADRLALSGLGEYSSWIGRQALTDAPVAYEGLPVDLHFTTATGADAAQLAILDESGREVGRMDLVPGQTSVTWSGSGYGGAVLGRGNYTFKVESFSAGATLGLSPAVAYATVTEVRAVGPEPVLVLRGGAEVAPANVRALRIAG